MAYKSLKFLVSALVKLHELRSVSGLHGRTSSICPAVFLHQHSNILMVRLRPLRPVPDNTTTLKASVLQIIIDEFMMDTVPSHDIWIFKVLFGYLGISDSEENSKALVAIQRFNSSIILAFWSSKKHRIMHQMFFTLFPDSDLRSNKFH